jgi:hypothetical protein
MTKRPAVSAWTGATDPKSAKPSDPLCVRVIRTRERSAGGAAAPRKSTLPLIVIPGCSVNVMSVRSCPPTETLVEAHSTCNRAALPRAAAPPPPPPRPRFWTFAGSLSGSRTLTRAWSVYSPGVMFEKLNWPFWPARVMFAPSPRIPCGPDWSAGISAICAFWGSAPVALVTDPLTRAVLTSCS